MMADQPQTGDPGARDEPSRMQGRRLGIAGLVALGLAFGLVAPAEAADTILAVTTATGDTYVGWEIEVVEPAMHTITGNVASTDHPVTAFVTLDGGVTAGYGTRSIVDLAFAGTSTSVTDADTELGGALLSPGRYTMLVAEPAGPAGVGAWRLMGPRSTRVLRRVTGAAHAFSEADFDPAGPSVRFGNAAAAGNVYGSVTVDIEHQLLAFSNRGERSSMVVTHPDGSASTNVPYFAPAGRWTFTLNRDRDGLGPTSSAFLLTIDLEPS